MAKLGRKARLFLDSFPARRWIYETAAAEAERHVRDIVKTMTAPLHAVTSRAKSTTSLRGKVRRKGYLNPQYDVTDLVGVRVITYFSRDLDRVAAFLRAGLEISEAKSRDARRELAEDQFGYRSIHLICRVHPSSRRENLEHLGRRWFEIQVRSILDHAWSEIEHEVVYKSGITYPEDVRRRFKALAGSLEIMEHAFADLAVERLRLVERYQEEYGSGSGMERRFDAARLEAFLNSVRPNGLSWAKAEMRGDPIPAGLGLAALEALASASLDRASRLQAVMRTRPFRSKLADFASLEGIAPDEVSHLAVAVIAVLSEKPELLKTRFPEIVFSPSFARIMPGQGFGT